MWAISEERDGHREDFRCPTEPVTPTDTFRQNPKSSSINIELRAVVHRAFGKAEERREFSAIDLSAHLMRFEPSFPF
jgi:hypothetical protein